MIRTELVLVCPLRIGLLSVVRCCSVTMTCWLVEDTRDKDDVVNGNTDASKLELCVREKDSVKSSVRYYERLNDRRCHGNVLTRSAITFSNHWTIVVLNQ